MWRRFAESPLQAASLTRRMLTGGLAAFLFCLCTMSAGAATESVMQLLHRADEIKSADYATFLSLMQSLERRQNELSVTQRQQLRYLEAWSTAYKGDYEQAIATLKSVVAETSDPTLKFRAHATTVNVMAISKRYEEAFTELGQLLELLPRVSDHDARQQGLGVASLFYNRVGQYDLAINYAEKLLEENPTGRGACTGSQLKLEALSRSMRLDTVTSQFQSGIAACMSANEPVFANLIRADVARVQSDRGRYTEAIDLLKSHYDEALRTNYPPLIAGYNALLAQAYRQTGETALTRRYALRAVESDIKNEYTEALVTAYRLLYLLAREQGDYKSALAYHEKYAAADKGYLDDVSAKQLAYERVKHEAIAGQLQIDALNKQNQVLQLQQALDRKAVETSRLYIVMLMLVLAFIALFAYRTKRSQLHFMKLSRQDGLTGIANRPHFIELAQGVLGTAQRAQREVCVILCDLDHFKAINDQYGHAAGDTALREVVATCRAHLRPDDVFGRVGGEEFGVLLPGCSLEAARERCERLRTALGQLVIAHEGKLISVSGSFGVETTASGGYDLRQLLANADAALYQAKHAGRDRVIVYDGSDSVMQESTHTGRLRIVRERFNLNVATHAK